MWVATTELPRSSRLTFYGTKNHLLAQPGCDRRRDELCTPYCAYRCGAVGAEADGVRQFTGAFNMKGPRLSSAWPHGRIPAPGPTCGYREPAGILHANFEATGRQQPNDMGQDTVGPGQREFAALALLAALSGTLPLNDAIRSAPGRRKSR